MYSPKERIYTTPELSGPAGNAVLQQLRLEAILRKYGRLDSCEPYVYSSSLVPAVLPDIQRPLRTRRQTDDKHSFEKLCHGMVLPPRTLPKDPSEISQPFRDMVDKYKERTKRSMIPGAPPDDPYLQKPRDTVGGCKYGGVNLSNVTSPRQNPDIFKAFYPQKSPHRLPCIQKEKCAQKKNGPKPLGLKSSEVNKQITNLHKKKPRGTSKLKQQETKKRKKRAKKETEFHEWEQSRDGYLQRPHTFDSDQHLVGTYERFHAPEPGPTTPDPEQAQRTRISDEIKRGVNRKLNMFKEDDTRFRGNNSLVPVYNMTFYHGTDTFEQDKTTAPPVKGKKKRKKKKWSF